MDTVLTFPRGPLSLEGAIPPVSGVARTGGSPLPCLSSHKCIGGETTANGGKVTEALNLLTGSGKRMAECLCLEVHNLCKDFGLEKVGFLTLTFADDIQCSKEARRRFRSLRSNVIEPRYERAICVLERTKKKRIHYHLVVTLKEDIRTGFDFEEVKKQRYGSANAAIRSEWAFWRQTAPKYGFGRTELLPVKSSAEGIARYVGGYIKKHVGERLESDKGARLVSFIGYRPGDRRASARFSWNSDGGWLWRHKLQAFCEQRGFEDTDALQKKFGPRWAFLLQEAILGTVLPASVGYPSERASDRDRAWLKAGMCEDFLERMKNRAPRRPQTASAGGSDNDFKLPEGMRADGRKARFELVRIYDSTARETFTHLVPASMEREPW